MRISDAAAFLGVSDDTVRRWIDAGALPAERTRRPQGDRRVRLAEFAQAQARPVPDPSAGRAARPATGSSAW